MFVIAMIAFVLSVGALGAIAFSYFQGQQKYDSIAETANLDVNDVEGKQLDKLVVNWDELKRVNGDVVAWLFVPGTQINYPVVQGKDNDYYLTRDFSGDAGWLATYGTLFLDFRNTFNFQDDMNFIYGHNMRDGSMFASIAAMRDQESFDTSRTVYLLTPERNYRLKSFALVNCAGDDPIVRTTFADAQDRADYFTDIVERSVVEVKDNVDPTSIQRGVALSTCDDTGAYRYLLFCRIEDEVASGLSGNVGVDEKDDSMGIVDDLGYTSDKYASRSSGADASSSAAAA